MSSECPVKRERDGEHDTNVKRAKEDGGQTGILPLPLPLPLPSAAAPPPTASAAEVEAKLDAWEAAKRIKDFANSDRIRDELRKVGVEPKERRPVFGGTKGAPAYYTPPSAIAHGVATEAQLDAWVTAKRQKDFTTADRLRDELRAKGIEPKVARPQAAGHSAPAQHWQPPAMTSYYQPPAIAYPPMAYAPQTPGAMDAESEAQLAAWVSAKRKRDFVTSDALRDRLRAKGIDPEKIKPNDRASASQFQPPPYSQPSYAYQPPYAGFAGYQPPAYAASQFPVGAGFAAANTQQYAQPMPVPSPYYGAATPLAAAIDPAAAEATVQQMKDNWRAAKRRKDFTTSDAIRSHLRAMGIDPETMA